MSKVIKKGFVLLACAFMLLCGSLIPALTVSASAEETSSDRYYDEYPISTYAVDSETVNYSRRTMIWLQRLMRRLIIMQIQI